MWRSISVWRLGVVGGFSVWRSVSVWRLGSCSILVEGDVPMWGLVGFFVLGVVSVWRLEG